MGNHLSATGHHKPYELTVSPATKCKGIRPTLTPARELGT